MSLDPAKWRQLTPRPPNPDGVRLATESSQRQRLLELVEQHAAAAHAEAEVERPASREVRNRSEAGLASSAMLPSDTPTVTAPEGAPPPGRPQRKVSTAAPGASEPAESGTAEPKVEDKTDDKDVPDASARRAEKPTLAAPATPAAKVDFVDSSEEVESVEWSRFKV